MSRFIGIAFSTSDPRSYPSLAPTFLTFVNALTGASLARPTITQVTTTGIYGFTYAATIPTYFLVDGITTTPSTDRYVFGIIDPFHQVDVQLTDLSTTLSAVNSTLIGLGNSNIALGMTNVALGISQIAQGNTIIGLGMSGIAIGNSGLAYGNTNVAIGTSLSAIGNSIYAGLIGGPGASLSTEILLRIGSTLSSFGSTSVDPGDLFGFLKRAQEFREGDSSFSKTSGQWDISTRGGTLLISKSLSNSSTTVTKS